MVTVNSNDELLKKCSYVVISSYRRKVLETLKNDVKIPTKISEESGVGIKHVSNVLTDLKEHNLIVCINEDAHKGRLYRLTDEGKNVVSMIGEMDGKLLFLNRCKPVSAHYPFFTSGIFNQCRFHVSHIIVFNNLVITNLFFVFSALKNFI